jgi:hypothetical protein
MRCGLIFPIGATGKILRGGKKWNVEERAYRD